MFASHETAAMGNPTTGQATDNAHAPTKTPEVAATAVSADLDTWQLLQSFS